MAWRAPFPRARPTWAGSLLIGLAMAGIASALRWAILPIIAYNLPFISYFPFLLAASIWAGARGGLVALALSALVAGEMFFRRDDPLLPWAVGSFLVSGGCIVLAGALLAEAV